MPRDLLDYFDIGFIICTEDGKIDDINRSAFDILDLSEKFNNPDVLAGKDISVIFKEYSRMIERAVSEGSIKNLEFSYVRNDGSRAYLLHSIKVDDNARHVNMMVRDVTDEKQIEKSLKYSKKRLMSIIDLIPDIVYRLDKEGNIIFISDRISDYGYEPDELIGTKLVDLIHPEDRDTALYKVNERRSGERRTVFFHVRLITRSDTEVPLELESRTISNATDFIVNAEGMYIPDSDNNVQFLGTQGIARDISNRKYSAITLDIDEDKYHYVLNRLDDGFYEIDLAGNIIYVNDSLGKILGYERSELMGSMYTDFLLPENKEKVTMDFLKLLKGNDTTTMVDWKVLRKDGKGLHLEGSISIIKNKNGESTGFIGIVRDVTAKMKIEQDLFRARKLEAIGIFSGGIAHDYNNALTTIIGNLALAKLELNSGNSEIMEILNDAEDASIRVKDLTHKLSTLSQGGKPVKKPTDINRLIRDVIDTELHGYRGVIQVEVEGDLKMVEVDEFQIGHMIEYMLTNAVESMGEGSVIKINAENVLVEKEESHHEITLLTGEFIKITISDNGCGIDNDKLELIFDPYFSTKESRSGMGLAISYAVIKRHNGYISVKSEKGKGSAFSIYLPVNL